MLMARLARLLLHFHKQYLKEAGCSSTNLYGNLDEN